jgi:hypothetical protein
VNYVAERDAQLANLAALNKKVSEYLLRRELDAHLIKGIIVSNLNLQERRFLLRKIFFCLSFIYIYICV